MNTENRQIDSKTTMQVRIDIGMHQIIKIESAKARETIKEYLEEVLVEHWDRNGVTYADSKPTGLLGGRDG